MLENLLKLEGTLKRGFLFGGTWHKDFKLRGEILMDSIGEAEEIATSFGKNVLSEKDSNSAEIKNAIQLKRRCVKIGSISEDELKLLTVKDFVEKLDTNDYAIMLKTKALLEIETNVNLEINESDLEEVLERVKKNRN